MEKVDVKCGFTCNNRCLFCVQGDKRERYGDIPTDQVMETLKAARGDADSIVFTGGEVTIKKDFILLVKQAAELGFRHIQIQTNGRMFSSRNFCRETVRAGANDFSLALHGHVPELHDYLTRAGGSFFQTVKGIRNLKELGQRVGTNSVITRPNYRNLPALARLLIHLGVDQFQFAFVHPVGSAMANFTGIVPRLSLAAPYVKSGLALGLKAGKTVMTEAIPYCFMAGFSHCIAEQRIPRTKIFDVQIVSDFTAYRIEEGKAKSSECGACIHDQVCEGPWKEYPEHYGWDEFRPVRQADTG